jgi:hypothetical protein
MKNMSKLLPCLLLLAALFGASAPAARAQGTNLGSIRGTVTDQNGAALPGAQVQVTDLQTNITTTVTTSDEGNYEASNLKFGSYRLTVTNTGFKSAVINEVVVQGSTTVRADAALQVGEATEQVTVQAEAGVIQNELPTITNTLSNQQLAELPRDSRDINQFLFLNPNITQGVDEGSFKFIGAQSYGANFSLDGQRTNGGIFGAATLSQPSLESVGELTVLSNNFTAEYSGIANIRVVTKRGGAQYHGSLFYNNRNSALAAWTIQDKRSLSTFTPTPALSSFPTPYFNLNETGGSFNGPVPFSKKTFFLGSYERRWDLAPVQYRSSNGLPHVTYLNGDFRQLDLASRPAIPAEVAGLLTPEEIANNTQLNAAGARVFNVIPQRLLNPIALGYVQNYYPQSSPTAPIVSANGRLVDYFFAESGLITRDLVTTRIDHDFSDRDKFYASYNYQKREGSRTRVANPFPAFGTQNDQTNNHTLSLSYTRIFGNNFVNEARGGFNIQKSARGAKFTTREFLQSLGFNEQEIASYSSGVGELLLDLPGYPQFVFGSFTRPAVAGNNAYRTIDQNLMTFGDTATYIRGNHTFKAGADFVQNKANDASVITRNNPRGTVNYATNTTGFTRFLLGLAPTNVQVVDNVRPVLEVHNWEDGFFFLDDWKIHPRLTLNLGLRYELITPFIEENDVFINFDPEGTNPKGNKGVFIIPSERTLPYVDQRIINYGVVTADEAGVGRGLVNTDANNFAPRLGASWRITDKSVIRGGWGVFYPTSAAQLVRDTLGRPGFNQRITRTGTTANPLSGLPGGINPRGITPFSGGGVEALQGGAPGFAAVPAGLQSPRVDQFNITFEQEVGWDTGVRVSYLGTRMHNLVAGFDLNMIAPSNVPFGTRTATGAICSPDDGNCVASAADLARLPFPQFGDFIAIYKNFGEGKSNALQFELNRRFTRGLTINATYTLLDQQGSALDVGGSSIGGTIYNQFNPNNDYARDAFVSRHRFVTYGVYDLPVGKGRMWGKGMNRAVDAVVGGWQVSWNAFAKSGTGFTPFWSCGNCGTGTGRVFPGNIASSFPDAVGGFGAQGSFRANYVSGQNPILNQGEQYLNPAAFTVPTAGADVFDNPDVAKRNSLTGPGTWGANLGLRKNFRFTETTKLEIGADFNNVFNHPMKSPLDMYFANLGTFFIKINPTTGAPEIDVARTEKEGRNPDFGKTINSFGQEGIDPRRLVRVRLRLTF